ncbi:MAG TPA: S1C family serine protease [Gemmataceae bacterium]|nr:S1C family serine protease [Gemmataceae bacterium]
MLRLTLLTALVLLPSPAAAADPFNEVSEKVNTKMVKLFGAGGFSRLTNFGTGIVISPDGHILTVASQLLDTSDLVVHLYDGRRMTAAVMVVEPELDAAILKIKVEGKKLEDPTGLELPFFDFAEAVKRPQAQPGDWVLAFSNAFEAGQRDEMMTAQRGVVAAYTKLVGRRGVFEFPYSGDVYVVDSITNNPGAAGGALTDRKGNLLGIVGRDIQNSLTETMINYAIPVGAKADVKVKVKVNDKEEEKTVTLTLPEFVAKGMKGEYKPVKRDKPTPGEGGYHGIVFVPNILERTPPYIEDVVPGSPAAKAGLKADDLVSFIDGEPISSIKVFQDYMKKNTRSDTTIRVEVRRGEALQTVELKLAPQPPRTVGPPPVKK